MLVRQVALVPDGVDIDVKKIMRIASALQKQVTRDFGPIWDVNGTVDGFARLEDMPLGYWPVMIVEDVEDASGIHQDNNGQPYSLVEFDDSWSLTASHEVLEMLADPFGDRLIAGKSPKQDQGRVEFLVEVCDPCEDAQHAYTVNDVLVSDFYTPNYFEPVARDGVQYSFTGAITKPRQVLPGGYLSWHDPVSDHWFQQTFFDSEPEFADIGAQERKEGSLREMIDTLSQRTKRLSHLPRKTPQLRGAITAAAAADEASVARANSLRANVERAKARTRR
jgi:hypothetical protein